MFDGFSPQLFTFFEELAANNRRAWFAANKWRYEEFVLHPAMEFVTAMEAPLKKLSPHFEAIPKRVGGSIMRIYRDTRFSKDKTPYKTNLGIHFRHEAGKNVHAPGFYFHIDVDEIFVGVGLWRPDNSTLKQIRKLIDDDPQRWKRAKNKKAFREQFEIGGETLKRPPQGYDADHPLIIDLKRKDHIGISRLDRQALYSGQLVETVIARYRTALPYMRFLCDAIHRPC